MIIVPLVVHFLWRWGLPGLKHAPKEEEPLNEAEPPKAVAEKTVVVEDPGPSNISTAGSTSEISKKERKRRRVAANRSEREKQEALKARLDSIRQLAVMEPEDNMVAAEAPTVEAADQRPERTLQDDKLPMQEEVPETAGQSKNQNSADAGTLQESEPQLPDLGSRASSSPSSEAETVIPSSSSETTPEKLKPKAGSFIIPTELGWPECLYGDPFGRFGVLQHFARRMTAIMEGEYRGLVLVFDCMEASQLEKIQELVAAEILPEYLGNDKFDRYGVLRNFARRIPGITEGESRALALVFDCVGFSQLVLLGGIFTPDSEAELADECWSTPLRQW